MNILTKTLKELERLDYGCLLESVDGDICGCCNGDDIRQHISSQIRDIKEMIRSELGIPWLDRPENKGLSRYNE